MMKKRTLFIATICFMLMAACGPKPGEVVEEYYKAVQNHDYATALSYSNVSDDVHDLVLDILDSSEVVVHHYKVLGYTIYPGDSTAVVDLYLSTSNILHPDSVADNIKVPCVKSKGKWVVKML